MNNDTFDFLSDDDKAFLEKYAEKIIKKRLEVPIIFILETMKPLNFIGSQLMLGAEPILSIFLNTKDFSKFQKLLEHRETIEYFLQLLETKTPK